MGTCLLCKKDHVGNLRRHVSAFHPEQTAEAHRHVETGHPNRHNANFWISSVFLGLTIVCPVPSAPLSQRATISNFGLEER